MLGFGDTEFSISVVVIVVPALLFASISGFRHPTPIWSSLRNGALSVSTAAVMDGGHRWRSTLPPSVSSFPSLVDAIDGWRQIHVPSLTVPATDTKVEFSEPVSNASYSACILICVVLIAMAWHKWNLWGLGHQVRNLQNTVRAKDRQIKSLESDLEVERKNLEVERKSTRAKDRQIKSLESGLEVERKNLEVERKSTAGVAAVNQVSLQLDKVRRRLEQAREERKQANDQVQKAKMLPPILSPLEKLVDGTVNLFGAFPKGSPGYNLVEGRKIRAECDATITRLQTELESLELQMRSMTAETFSAGFLKGKAAWAAAAGDHHGFGTWAGKYARPQGFAAHVIKCTDPVFKALQKFMHVPDARILGTGRDVPYGDWKNSRDQKSIQLARAWRIENPELLDQFKAARSKVGKQIGRLGGKLQRLSSALDTAVRDLCSASGDTLDEGINETFLLHGTKPESLATILANGTSEKFSGGLFGEGTYLAEDISKNDQYVQSPLPANHSANTADVHLRQLHTAHLYRNGAPSHPNDPVYYVVVCRVAMGWFARTKDGSTQLTASVTRSLWAKQHKELALISDDPPVHFHSLLAETGGCIGRHREFLQYHQDRIYPAYLLAYHRKLSDSRGGQRFV